jgi:hypothetical protein
LEYETIESLKNALAFNHAIKFQFLAQVDEKTAVMQRATGLLDQFWKDVNVVLEKSSDRSMLQNIARLRYVVKSDPEIKSWFELEARVNSLQKKCFQFKISMNNYLALLQG